MTFPAYPHVSKSFWFNYYYFYFFTYIWEMVWLHCIWWIWL